MERIALLLAVLLLAAACGSPSKSGAGVEPAGPSDLPLPPQSTPWTEAFLEGGVLMASEVRISGPPGLIAHFVGRVEEGITSEVKTLPEGLRQTYAIDGSAEVLVRGQLDRLEIFAERRIVVLERPGPVDVVVEARGDVLHRDSKGEERRSSSLRLVGAVPR